MQKGSIKLGQIHKTSYHKLQSDTKLCHKWNTIFSSLWKRPQLTFTLTSEPMQWFLGDPESGLLNLEAHHLVLVITKKTLDENHFRTTHKTTDREPLSFKIANRVNFENKQPGKWDLKWRPGYGIVHIEHDGHYLHIKNQATGKTRSCNIKDVVLKPPVELWNVNKQFGRVGRDINHPANFPNITLTDWRWKKNLLIYIVTCK